MVVEDEWLVAKHVQVSLQAAGFNVLNPVHSARAAIELAAMTSPDVIVMDIKLDGDRDGIRAASEITKQRWTPVVYLTAHSDRESVSRAAEGHAAGYILKPFVERQLVSAVLMAAHGAQRTAGYFASSDPMLEDRIRALASVPPDTPSRAATPVRPMSDPLARRLSPREGELVTMLAKGARVSSIARKLGLSTHTVRNHLKSIFRKLDIHSQHELVEFWRSQPEFNAD